MRGVEFHGNTRRDGQPAYPVYKYKELGGMKNSACIHDLYGPGAPQLLTLQNEATLNMGVLNRRERCYDIHINVL